MTPEAKLAAMLATMFIGGLVLVGYGLGLTTKLAATGTGLLLCFAAVRLLAGGPPNRR